MVLPLQFSHQSLVHTNKLHNVNTYCIPVHYKPESYTAGTQSKLILRNLVSHFHGVHILNTNVFVFRHMFFLNI